ncbi:two-component sensor histidine kinase [filamentous cyanobacterium CCP1]|nr:two-component sensor histidine kinase [filamentous cyanobacterium CCP2]PSB68335.1 two-component sensor histidine kinase [filamentous cyanobacterium CCP1]
MLVAVGIAIPIFRALLFFEVDNRVQSDLQEELKEFAETYTAWDAVNPEDDEALEAFVQDFLTSNLTEDDNYHLVFLKGEFFQSNPKLLPEVLAPESELSQQWATLTTATEDRITIDDSAVGSVLYSTYVLETNNIPRGVFVAVHLTAGERIEALASVYVFTKVAIGVVVFSFLLAWLASQQLLKPVQNLALTARSISETDLSCRLEVKGTGELAELSSTFNSMMNRLQKAFESQRNFINDAGHELFTPLTIIQGHLEVMGDDPNERATTLSLVMDEIDRMSRFANDLLLLAQAEEPSFLELETINVADFTQEVFAKIAFLDDRQWHLGSLGRGVMVGDRQRLTSALLNLAKNAAQHTHPTDTIELGSATIGGQVRFWVRDTGEGIAPADQERIFDRFARAANTYRKSEGAGLGLAIVKTVAESHHGTVELVSQLGTGSTFTLVLPLDLPQQEQAA